MWNGGIIFGNKSRLRARFFGLLALTLCCVVSAGQCGNPVPIEFVPPPMEGTISLGIYDASGKLVRVLHREAETDTFIAGDDGLKTQWDGKNDTGADCPPGSYQVRGIMVGDLKIEGIDFIGNDWVTEEDSPRLRRIADIETGVYGDPVITATAPDKPSFGRYSLTLEKPTSPGDDPEVRLMDRHVSRPPDFIPPSRLPFWPIPGVKNVTDWVGGLNDSVWVIQKGVVKQYSQKGDVLRTLERSADDPPAARLAARDTKRRITSGLAPDPGLAVFDTGEKLYVLYENAKMQRLRGYDFTGVKPGAAPKLLFEKDILSSNTYEQIASELKFPDESPFVPSPTLKVELVANPLDFRAGSRPILEGSSAKSITLPLPEGLEIAARVDKDGAYLATADGLPLCHINESKFLRWAVIGRAPKSKAIMFFNSDGAVVEEFQISNPGNLMTFDAGIVTLPAPTSATPSPTPAKSPGVQ